MNIEATLERLRGTLIVSCQARHGTPLDRPSMIVALARSAVLGGASAVRICGIDEIRSVRDSLAVPVIGLVKRDPARSSVYITPTLRDALSVRLAGADLVAIDATLRPRPGGRSTADLLRALADRGVPVLADVDNLEAAVAAADGGASAVATTLAGHTGGQQVEEPDIELLRAIRQAIHLPVIAEGRFRSPEQVGAAFEAGAHAVVVGGAITDPIALTRRLANAAPNAGSRNAERQLADAEG